MCIFLTRKNNDTFHFYHYFKPNGKTTSLRQNNRTLHNLRDYHCCVWTKRLHHVHFLFQASLLFNELQILKSHPDDSATQVISKSVCPPQRKDLPASTSIGAFSAPDQFCVECVQDLR
mmetsp:Transcript_14857/g.22134  ORF Transcript_14857/g.22134 Transcript_14857/m.22134 type:complete len:118 (+) Transcript_14857:414-767(+)